jgi:integrase
MTPAYPTSPSTTFDIWPGLTALAGGTIKEIQARMGHATADAAMIYQHVAQGRDGLLAAEIDRIVSEGVK